jgi:UPF0716 protein FxsA
MGLILLAAFIAVPLIEIAVFIQVGGLIGLWPTLAIVILTAIAGSAMLRSQGLATAQRARQQMDRGVMPTRELFDGICLVFAGALLLTPGFVTDIVGLLLFVPPFRDLLRTTAGRYVQRHAQTRVYTYGGPGDGARNDPRNGAGAGGPGWRADDPRTPPPERPGRGWGRPAGAPGTIEGDYQDVTPPEEPDGPPSGSRGGAGHGPGDDAPGNDRR